MVEVLVIFGLVGWLFLTFLESLSKLPFFPVIVAAGTNSSLPHYRPQETLGGVVICARAALIGKQGGVLPDRLPIAPPEAVE